MGMILTGNITKDPVKIFQGKQGAIAHVRSRLFSLMRKVQWKGLYEEHQQKIKDWFKQAIIANIEVEDERRGLKKRKGYKAQVKKRMQKMGWLNINNIIRKANIQNKFVRKKRRKRKKIKK